MYNLPNIKNYISRLEKSFSEIVNSLNFDEKSESNSWAQKIINQNKEFKRIYYNICTMAFIRGNTVENSNIFLQTFLLFRQ